MRAIVLSGGGAKGSYEIGVWKALRKLNINYDIVTGTSVGALNGALMVQKSYLKALFLWYNIHYDDIFEMKKNYTKEEINDLYKDGILNGGVDVSNLENTIKKCIRPNSFFKSKIKFGLVTVKVPSLKHVYMTKDKLTKNNLHDYLVASASCFPAFKLKKINNEHYIDGGFYDNMPINLAIEMGATEVIAVDLDAIGVKRNLKYDVPVTYITPKNKIDSFLKFEKNSARRGMRLGYNDTMKHYKKLDGDLYTFKLNNLENNFLKYKKSIIKNIENIIGNDSLIIENIVLKKIFKNDKSFFKELNEIIEKIGYIYEIDDSYIYDIKVYNNMIIQYFNNTILNQNELDKDISKDKIKMLFNEQKMVKYIYELIIKKQYKKLKNLIIIYPEEFLMAIYIKTIKGD
ncbi:MAG: patatin-like phospholipase family protein [Lactobacillales bacterium]|nr:patatin-like phospholipase family protein [Lactobacillales bacterium]